MSETTVLESLRLHCVIEGESVVFTVTAERNVEVGDLKKVIQKERELDTLKDVGPHSLELWKPKDSNPITAKPSGTLVRRIKSLGDSLSQFSDELDPTDNIFSIFPTQPSNEHLHIIVKVPPTAIISPSSSNESNRVANVPPTHSPSLPRTPEHPKKRPRIEASQVTPPRMAKQDIVPAMRTALEPFTQYLRYLAEGKLDGYFNSIQPEDLNTDLKVTLPMQPMLLLHDLGKYTDQETTQGLFIPGTSHLFAVSGSGKTRRTLEGLCHYWGFYISCQNQATGSRDFEKATELMRSMSKWDNGKEDDMTKNADVAKRAFAMLICARVFVLNHLLKNLPKDADVMVARKRWVLAQVLPPSLPFVKDDIFAVIVNNLRSAESADMLQLTSIMLQEITKTVGKEIFSRTTALFAVVDEAQVAAEYLDDAFRSITTGTDMRPVLHAFLGFLWETRLFQGVVLAETGLSMKKVKTTLYSQAAKYLGGLQEPLVYVELGRFKKNGTIHEDYIRKYLSLSDSLSDRRLVERILYWFSGRYRFTATLIELLLYTQPGSKHRILSALAKSLTQFTITDALDLEEKELPLTANTVNKIHSYGEISAVDRLFEQEDRELLILALLEALMKWRIGSQATLLPIEANMHEIVALSIGHLESISSDRILRPGETYPVYLCEPLTALYLSSVFENHSWTRKQAWVAREFRTARDNSSRGHVFEEVVLLAIVLMEMFGGKSRPLSDAFHCEQPWGSRNVTLVSLKRGVDDILQSSSVSWTSGSSDRVGFKATSPTDVLQFLNNPDGKCFLFPDVHMGPDLLCFLQDEETKELILLALQAKISKSLDANIWKSALDSITPQFFYTVKAANTKNGRVQYAPSAYPGLSDDITDVLQWMLGPAEFKPMVDLFNDYRQKLGSTTVLNQHLMSRPSRETPKYLRIIATHDDDQTQRLKADWKGDVGILRWDDVEEYLGSTARAGATTLPSGSIN